MKNGLTQQGAAHV